MGNFPQALGVKIDGVNDNNHVFTPKTLTSMTL